MAGIRRAGRFAPVHPNWVVEAARELHEAEGWGYKRIAKKLEVSRYTVRDWCVYRTRIGSGQER